MEWTRAPRDAERIAREGVRAGIERIVVAGGDGTTSEVVSGLLGAQLGNYAEVAPLPLGTGGDMLRTLEVPRQLDRALEGIAAGSSRKVDAGRVRYTDRERPPAHRPLPERDELRRERPDHRAGESRHQGLRGSRLLSARNTSRNHPLPARGGPDSRTGRAGPRRSPGARDRGERPLLRRGDAGCAPGRASGRPLRCGRHSGLLQGSAAARAAAHLPRHPPRGSRGLSPPRHSCIEAEAAPGRVWVEIDGEPLGTLPASIEVLPAAISVLGSPG